MRIPAEASFALLCARSILPQGEPPQRVAREDEDVFFSKITAEKLCRFAQTTFFKLKRQKSLSKRYETGVNVNFL